MGVSSKKVLFVVAFIFTTKKSNLVVAIVTMAIALSRSFQSFRFTFLYGIKFCQKFSTQMFWQIVSKTWLTDSGLLPYSAMQHLYGTLTCYNDPEYGF